MSSLRLALLLVLSPFVLQSATSTYFQVNGGNLTVTSNRLKVVFQGGDVVGISNQLTGEDSLRNTTSSALLKLTSTPASTGSFAASAWVVSSDGSSANLNVSDGTSAVTISVSVDSRTQEIVVDLDGKSSKPGVQKLSWGVSGFDLGAGKFILPANGGISLTADSFVALSSFTFSASSSSQHWEAPLALFQQSRGGVAIYSTDTQSMFKDLNLTTNQQGTANGLFQVQAAGPWNSATEAGPVEWRLAAYQGPWQAGAQIYRDWHNAAMPPVPLTGSRAWAGGIQTVVQVGRRSPFESAVLDRLATLLTPASTLLYLPDWRAATFDLDYPNYTPEPSVAAFLQHARNLGFRVMLHANLYSIAPTNADFAAVQQFQAKDASSLQPKGWLWSLPSSTPNRAAWIDPASSVYRSLLLQRLSVALGQLQPDAVHLDVSGAPINDGNGLIAGMNFVQGTAQFHRDLLNAFPGMVIGGEGTYDAISPYQSFAQQWVWPLGYSPDVTPPVPITAYVLPNVRSYGHLGSPNPSEAGFLRYFQQYEAQAVLPTLSVTASVARLPDFSQPDFARYLKMAQAFQRNQWTPAWDSDWSGAIVSYQGVGGTAASLSDSGTLVHLDSASGPLYQRAHGVNHLISSLQVPLWPAYSDTAILGLDPGFQYWLDSAGGNSNPVRITGLPDGVRVGLGTGTLVTPDFSYFQLLPPSVPPFDFLKNIWSARTGVVYGGTESALSGGAVVNTQTMTVGGSARRAIYTQPPFSALRGGTVFVEYSVAVPASAGVSLSFAAGILDTAIGQRQAPLTFQLLVNGAVLWQQDVSTGGWQPGSVDLSGYQGQTVKIRFVTDPGPSGPSSAWGGWATPQFSASGDGVLGTVSLAVPSGLPAANVSASGGTASVAAGIATVSGLLAGGTMAVFTGQPVAAALGQTLGSLPFRVSQASTGQLAGPSQVTNAGQIGSATSGGVTKQRTIYGFAPPNGQTILSWYLQLPASPLGLSFSAGYFDGFAPASQGSLLSVRVNGATLWHYNLNLPAKWEGGSVDLSSWAGQKVVVELISDSLGPNTNDYQVWGDATLTGAGTATCATSVSSTTAISAPPGGMTGAIGVTTGAGCAWSADPQSDWITASPSGAAGPGSVTYTIAANVGQARQSVLVVAGHAIAVNQAGAVAAATPRIQSVVNAASGRSLVARNTWLEIYGTNLARTTRSWRTSDFSNGRLPAQLDGVSATVDGKPAFVSYVSPSQVNVLSPADAVSGTVQVVLTVGGVSSNALAVAAQSADPGLFQFSGGRYLAATHANGSYLGPATLYPGLSTPAKRGEVVTLYGGGFGQTNPALTSGSVVQPVASLPSKPVVTLDGVAAVVQFAGVVAPGLYQFNIVIPASLADGDHVVVVSYGGFSTPSTGLITVRG